LLTEWIERVLKRFRDNIRLRQYVMTIHAEEEMDDDHLSIFDVESAILTGQILERQRDRKTREWKDVVSGRAIDGARVGVVGKLSSSGQLGYPDDDAERRRDVGPSRPSWVLKRRVRQSVSSSVGLRLRRLYAAAARTMAREMAELSAPSLKFYSSPSFVATGALLGIETP
jgi:hypothetical protein